MARLVRARVERSSLATAPYAVAVRAGDGSGAQACSGRLGADAVTADSVMYAASLAKQVIGLLAAQLVVAGRLEPGDALSDHLEELPGWARRIRLRHLVHHTSGLPTDLPAEGVGGNDQVMAGLRLLPPPVAEPGSTYRYSNLGYICLAEVVRRAGGRRVEDQAADLFVAWDLPTARLGGPGAAVPRGQQHPPPTVGDGGLWLSVGDLRSWNDALNRRALGAAVHALAETPGTLDDGTALDYAWGVRVMEHAGRRTLSHGGSWPSWSAKAIRHPDQGVSVAILTTSPDISGITALALDLGDEVAALR
jgi:CubicO group peptidase (beta-lactamase class C family)